MYAKITIYALTVAVLTPLMYMAIQPVAGFKSKAITLICCGAIAIAELIAVDSFMGDQPIIDALKAELAERKQKAKLEKPDLDSLYQQAVLDALGEQP